MSSVYVSSDHKSQLLRGIVGSIALPLDCSVKRKDMRSETEDTGQGL